MPNCSKLEGPGRDEEMQELVRMEVAEPRNKRTDATRQSLEPVHFMEGVLSRAVQAEKDIVSGLGRAVVNQVEKDWHKEKG